MTASTPLTPPGSGVGKVPTQDATKDDKLTYQSVGKSGTLVKVTLIKDMNSSVRLEIVTQSRVQRFVNAFLKFAGLSLWETKLKDLSRTIKNKDYFGGPEGTGPTREGEKVLSYFGASEGGNIAKDFKILIKRSEEAEKANNLASRTLGTTANIYKPDNAQIGRRVNTSALPNREALYAPNTHGFTEKDLEQFVIVNERDSFSLGRLIAIRNTGILTVMTSSGGYSNELAPEKVYLVSQVTGREPATTSEPTRPARRTEAPSASAETSAPTVPPLANLQLGQVIDESMVPNKDKLSKPSDIMTTFVNEKMSNFSDGDQIKLSNPNAVRKFAQPVVVKYDNKLYIGRLAGLDNRQEKQLLVDIGPGYKLLIAKADDIYLFSDLNEPEQERTAPAPAAAATHGPAGGTAASAAAAEPVVGERGPSPEVQELMSKGLTREASELWIKLEEDTSRQKVEYVRHGVVQGRYPDIHCARNTAILSGNVYLHANKMTKPEETEFDIVAGQSPRPEERFAFWTEIIKQGYQIVDLTNPEDREQYRALYFPQGEGASLSGVVGTKITQVGKARDNVYKYDAAQIGLGDGTPKSVSRYSYNDWPDHGKITDSELHKLVGDVRSLGEKLWIVCHAGVGRTGTLTVALRLQEEIMKRKAAGTSIDVKEILSGLILQMRERRDPHIVQTPGQLQLLLDYGRSLQNETLR